MLGWKGLSCVSRGLLDETFDAAEDEAAISGALVTVGSEAHRAVEREIAQAAITLVRDDLSAVPFRLKRGETMLLITPYANETASALYALNGLKAEGKVPEDVLLETYVYRGKNEVDEDLGAKLARADYILLQTEMSGTASLLPGHWVTDLPAAVWDQVKKAGRQDRFVLASIGAPFDIVNFADCPAVLLSYGCVGMSDADAASGVITGKYGPNLPALLCAVLGDFIPEGSIPVTIPATGNQ